MKLFFIYKFKDKFFLDTNAINVKNSIVAVWNDWEYSSYIEQAQKLTMSNTTKRELLNHTTVSPL